MCDCKSCSFTDSFASKGFAAWPRGEPAGKAASERSYAAHVRHAWSGAYKTIAFKPGQPPRYPFAGTRPLDPGEDRKYPKWDWAEGKGETAAYVAAFISQNNYVTQEKIA